MSEDAYSSVVLKHYDRELVREEIARFASGRWVAVHCQTLNKDGRPYLLRYFRKAKRKIPLKIDSPKDVSSIIERFSKLKPRTFYASINIYRNLSVAEDVQNLENITYCLPTWDIDNRIEKWKATIEVAKEILKFLKLHGVEQSIFLKWSGNGIHIHIHHRAFSEQLLTKNHPLDIAYSIVEYVNVKLHEKYITIAGKHHAERLRIENKIDMQRVFTCSLSLHRQLNKVAVCIDPQAIDEFSPAWASLETFKHWRGWNQHVEGEADSLATKAYKAIGGYPLKRLPGQRVKRKMKLDELILKWIRKDSVQV